MLVYHTMLQKQNPRSVIYLLTYFDGALECFQHFCAREKHHMDTHPYSRQRI